MADPAEELAELTKLQNAILDLLDDELTEQRDRWGVMREMIDNACLTLTTLRIDAIEARLNDQGPPLWLSCLLTLAVTLIPVTAMSGLFMLAVTQTTQRLLTNADRQLMKSFMAARHLSRESIFSNPLLKWSQDKTKWLGEEIKRTESMVAKFAKVYEPEVSNTLQNVAGNLGVSLGKHMFQTESGKLQEMKQANDVPVVVLKNYFYDWVRSQEHVEHAAYKRLKEKLRALFDIATTNATETAKLLKTYENLLTGEERPKNRNDAKTKMTEWQKKQAEVVSARPGKIKLENLREFQLTIESMIWCTTYDFTPRRRLKIPLGKFDRPEFLWDPAPLPSNVWKRLIERYIDPTARKTYKELGPTGYLGPLTEANPNGYGPLGSTIWSPEIRLSYYFSKVLFPQLTSENSEAIRRLKVP